MNLYAGLVLWLDELHGCMYDILYVMRSRCNLKHNFACAYVVKEAEASKGVLSAFAAQTSVASQLNLLRQIVIPRLHPLRCAQLQECGEMH